MPRLSVWFIRLALIYLLLGITLGSLLLWNKGIPLHPLIWRLLPVHIECLFIGWTLQLALGVAFWILPRFRTSRGNEVLAWLAFGMLNAGVCLVSIGILVGTDRLLMGGRTAEVAAMLAFTLHAWPRIKPVMLG